MISPLAADAPLARLFGVVSPLWFQSDNPVDGRQTFAALRSLRASKRRVEDHLKHLHSDSAACVATVVDTELAVPLEIAYIRSQVVQILLARPALVVDDGSIQSRLGCFLDCERDKLFIAHLRLTVRKATGNTPSSFIAAALNSERLEPTDLGLQLASIYVEEAIGDPEDLSPAETAGIDVWGIEQGDEDRQRAALLSRLAGRKVRFISDIPSTISNTLPLPPATANIIWPVGTENGQMRRWRSSGVNVLDVQPGAACDAYREHLLTSLLPVFDGAVDAAREAPITHPEARLEEAKHKSPTPNRTHQSQAPRWIWTSHARKRSAERGFDRLVLEALLGSAEREPFSITAHYSQQNIDNLVVIGRVSPSDGMVDGCKLLRGILPEEHDGRIVIFAVGLVRQRRSDVRIQTLYDPAEHPEWWNEDFTRGTDQGVRDGAFPTQIRWVLP